jgi:hypothetical protein
LAPLVFQPARLIVVQYEHGREALPVARAGLIVAVGYEGAGCVDAVYVDAFRRRLHRRGNAEVATSGLARGAHRCDWECTLVLHDPANGRDAVAETRGEGVGEHLDRTRPIASAAAIPELDADANQAARGQFPSPAQVGRVRRIHKQ